MPAWERTWLRSFRQREQVFEEADEALSFSISRLCFEGPKRTLQLTENTQPAIVSVSIAAFRAMQSARTASAVLQSPDTVWANTPHWLPRVQ